MEIPVTLQSDRKGYFDRECPNENCLYTFKINMQDWEEKVSDEEVHCPMCGHIDTSEKWWTQKQLEGKLKLEYYKLQKTFEGAIELGEQKGVYEPAKKKGAMGLDPKESTVYKGLHRVGI